MRLTVEFATHENNRHAWATITVFGMSNGRYGSQLVVTHELGEHDLKDPEELIAVLLDGVHGLVYHT